MQAGSSTFAFRLGRFLDVPYGGRINSPRLDSKDGALQIRHESCMPWLPSASTNGPRWPNWSKSDALSDADLGIFNVMKRWRIRAKSCWFLSQREWLWKTKGRPKDKEAQDVMNSILKAGTLQLFNDFHEYPGGPWINCQVLFRPFLKVTIQTTIKKTTRTTIQHIWCKASLFAQNSDNPYQGCWPKFAINQMTTLSWMCHDLHLCHANDRVFPHFIGSTVRALEDIAEDMPLKSCM